MSSFDNTLFIKACRCQETERTPVWFMRQAGRYMKEYHEVRAKASFTEICKTPELACEVTLQPIKRFGYDASIIFSDILFPCEAMGLPLEFYDGRGPVFSKRVETPADVTAMSPAPASDLDFVYRAISMTRKALDEFGTPLIGFAGAPFTLVSYMIEGGTSKQFAKLKSFMYNHPDSFKELMDKMTTTVTAYLIEQVNAGVQALQLFDSWAGTLSIEDYEEFALPWVKRIIADLDKTGVPRIYFMLNHGAYLDQIATCGADVIGVDWRTSLTTAREVFPEGTAVMGNLEPLVLYGPRENAIKRTQMILDEWGSKPGHVFNLGHGILPETPNDNVDAVLQVIQRKAASNG